MKKNFMITLEYDGTRYDGWQKQGNTGNTIQAKLEAVLSRWAGEKIEVAGSGRTDAGVHARGQTANFHISEQICPDAGTAARYLNRYLPDDIRVLDAQEAPERFHARLSAVGKTYAYYVETAEKCPVFERKYVCSLGACMGPACGIRGTKAETYRPGQEPFGRAEAVIPLDLAAMRRAAALLTGEHDFKSFCSNPHMKKSTVRRLDAIEIRQEGTRLEFRYHGNGFLYHMVRILTGTLLEVGLGRRSADGMPELLEAKKRERAGFTAPPEGLFLIGVEYADDFGGKIVQKAAHAGTHA